jgi:SAM-dependent methyltransferase
MITTWSRGTADDHMPEAILTKFAAQVAVHPWWQARSKLVLALLKELSIRPPARILDAGCGWGETLEVLEANGFEVTGLDISRQALERLDRPGRTLVEADLTRPFDEESCGRPTFDAILALDIIEHVDDDQALLSSLATLLKPGGHLIVNVPALPELFSEFDEVNGHRLRYEPPGLRAAFHDTNLAIERLFYWNAWSVPLFGLRRLGKKPTGRSDETLEIYGRHLALPPWPFPWLFRQAFAREQTRALKGQLERGTSLMAVARHTATSCDGEPDESLVGSGAHL